MNQLQIIDLSEIREESERPQVIKIEFPKLPAWNIEEETGYKPKTTFWEDFSIADAFGPEGVLSTFESAFREWRDDVEYIAELSLVLNHKIWAHYKARPILGETYRALWERLHDWAKDNFTGNDAEYYFNVTD